MWGAGGFCSGRVPWCRLQSLWGCWQANQAPPAPSPPPCTHRCCLYRRAPAHLTQVRQGSNCRASVTSSGQSVSLLLAEPLLTSSLSKSRCPDQPPQAAVPLSQLVTSFLCFQTHGFCEHPDCPPCFSRLGSHLEGSSW